MHFYCSSHDGGQKNAHQLIFPCNITENSPTLLAASIFEDIWAQVHHFKEEVLQSNEKVPKGKT